MSVLYPDMEKIREATKSAVTVFVENRLDQDITVQVKGNRIQSTDGAVNIGSSFTVSPSSSNFMTLTPETTGWLPFIYVELKCSTAPTSGDVTAYLIKGINREFKLVDGLEIRDTNTHDPSTDPNKVFIGRW